MFKLSFLPARFGDAIWIEYGSLAEPHFLLIDGGTAGTRLQISEKLSDLSSLPAQLDLLVISHIDRDHIEGVLGLLEQDTPGFGASEVWFNSLYHLQQLDDEYFYSPGQAERLTACLGRLGWDWNCAFGEGPVCLPEAGGLPIYELEGGMKITLLSPTRQALMKLRPEWEKEVGSANLKKDRLLPPNDEEIEEEFFYESPVWPDLEALAQSPYQSDTSTANASSIAFLAEYEGRRALLAADAPSEVLLASLERLSPGEPYPIDLLKVSHHGSRYTTSLALIQKLSWQDRTPRLVISTNGSIFKHPDAEAIGRVVVGTRQSANHPAELYFNYQRPRNEIWGSSALQERYGYVAHYPPEDSPGMGIDLAELP
jgi:beta-lactamase superfamily II metal-dependent hydrolase